MRLSTLLATALLVGVIAPTTAVAADMGIAQTAGYSDSQVRTLWSELRPSYSGAAYSSAPSVVAPYAPGAVNAGFLNDGLKTINFARFLAGVPHDVVLDSARSADAQYGAVLLAAGSFSHTPPKPADMPQAFYDRGYASTSSSNIGWGYATSASFETGCLADEDSGNISRVGHRRWLLNPPMLKTGIGYAASRHTTYAFDRSRTTQMTYSAIAYPSAGPFPMDQGFFDSYTPWSLTLNPSRYDWDGSGHTITLRRVSDGTTWTFTAADTDTSGEFFAFDTGGYGVANAFIFRPNPASIGYAAGDQFDVTLSGGVYAEGTRTPVTVRYRTRFMSLTGGNSAPITVKPKAKLTRTTSWRTRYRNRTYYAKGYIEPRHLTSDSNRVRIRAYKKRSDGRYHYVRSFTARYVYYSPTKTIYKAPVRFTSKGRWKLVAHHPADSTNAASSGSADYIRVR